MSRYCTVKTQFKDAVALVAALSETSGWHVDQIEVHQQPQHLYGYRGDVRNEVAHIIIRRQHVGSASNDIGFVRGDDGNYTAIISKYDSSKHDERWLANLKGNYAYHKIRRDQEARGRTVSRQRGENGRQRIVVTGYR